MAFKAMLNAPDMRERERDVQLLSDRREEGEVRVRDCWQEYCRVQIRT